MGREIERKFLVKDESWRGFYSSSEKITQGYLSRSIDRTVRVRVGETSHITIKGRSVGISRDEFEYEIPRDDAIKIIDMCEGVISKVRFKVNYGNHIWEIDLFNNDNSGLIIAEIELDSENENFEKPDWLGIEVSDDPRYFNSNLIEDPFKNWR